MDDYKKSNHTSSDNSMQRQSMAGMVKKIGTGYSIYRIVNTAIFAVILIGFAVFLIFAGVPYFITIPIIAIAVGIVVIEIITYKRVSSIDINMGNNKDVSITDIDANEKIIDFIPGIMRVGAGSGSYTLLGKGRNLSPENTALITGTNIWFVTIPMEGAGNVILETDISRYQWLLESKDIESRAREMMAALTLAEILKLSINSIRLPFNNIKKLKTSDISHSIIFKNRDNKKYNYCIRNPKDYEKAKNIFIKKDM